MIKSFTKEVAMSFGLYIHIPYCLSKCNYCNFYSAGNSALVPETYIDALLREIKKHNAHHPKTVYFGGGTPSLLSPMQVEKLLQDISPEKDAEITLEANPETICLEKLSGYKKAGVNRLSFGVQSANNKQLTLLGRKHTAETALQAFQLAQKAGFTNISGDIMLALPNYTVTEFDQTLTLIEQGGAAHISCYLLKVEEKTPFANMALPFLPDDDAAADFYLYAVEKLGQHGYHQYEISNFAKPSFESKHNLVYWNCKNYLGIGPAAHSCMHGKRFFYKEDTHAFIENDTSILIPDGALTAEDYIMLQLRLNSGLSLAILKEQFQYVFPQKTLQTFAHLATEHLCQIENNIITLTPKGMLLQNTILANIL